MSARTAWFYCGKCGFKNRPRPIYAAPVFKRADDGRYDLVAGDTLCEQCGSPNELEGSSDYRPGGD